MSARQQKWGIRQARGVLPIACLVAATSAGASTVGLQGSPSLDIYWQGTAQGSTPVLIASLAFTVDQQGSFALTSSQNYTQEGDSISLNQAEGNVDPFLNFGVAITDSGAPNVFSFLFSSPISPPITGPADYSLSLAGSFANSAANDGGSVAVAAPNSAGVLEGLLNGTTSIAGTGTAASFSSGGTSVYGPFATSGTYDCDVLSGCTSFAARVSFLGSGGGDVLTLSGTYELAAVPLPAAGWLIGPAFGLASCYARRRSRA